MTKWLLFVFSWMAVIKLFFYSENNWDSLNCYPNTNLIIVHWSSLWLVLSVEFTALGYKVSSLILGLVSIFDLWISFARDLIWLPIFDKFSFSFSISSNKTLISYSCWESIWANSSFISVCFVKFTCSICLYAHFSLCLQLLCWAKFLHTLGCLFKQLSTLQSVNWLHSSLSCLFLNLQKPNWLYLQISSDILLLFWKSDIFKHLSSLTSYCALFTIVFFSFWSAEAWCPVQETWAWGRIHWISVLSLPSENCAKPEISERNPKRKA